MKLGPVNKFDKRNTVTSKKIDDDVMSANFGVIVIVIMANLEQSESLIRDTWSVT